MSIAVYPQPEFKADDFISVHDLILALQRIPEPYRKTCRVYAYDGGYDGMVSRVRRAGVDVLQDSFTNEPLEVRITGDGMTTDNL